MGLLLRGLGGPAGALILGGMGQQVIIDDTALLGDTDSDAAYNARRKRWKEEPWWVKTQSFTVRAGMIEINGAEIFVPIYKTISKSIYDDPLSTPVIHAEYKWSKRLKAGLKNILINALRVIRNDKGSDSE